MDNKTLTVVAWDTGDWVAIYIDGTLVEEGQVIDAVDLVSIINRHLPIGTLSVKRLLNDDTYHSSAEDHLTDYADGELV